MSLLQQVLSRAIAKPIEAEPAPVNKEFLRQWLGGVQPDLPVKQGAQLCAQFYRTATHISADPFEDNTELLRPATDNDLAKLELILQWVEDVTLRRGTAGRVIGAADAAEVLRRLFEARQDWTGETFNKTSAVINILATHFSLAYGGKLLPLTVVTGRRIGSSLELGLFAELIRRTTKQFEELPDDWDMAEDLYLHGDGCMPPCLETDHSTEYLWLVQTILDLEQEMPKYGDEPIP